MTISKEIIREIKEELENKKLQREALVSQLTLLDVSIDKFDSIIVNIDKDALTFINNINQAILPVKQAYDARIAFGCRSDLKWELINDWNPSTSNFFDPQINPRYYKYQVIKDNGTYSFTPYRGIKYYQKPLNRDYGSNLVGLLTGSISTGSSILAITDVTIREDLIQIGDNIIDDLTSPLIFSSTNIPSVVGFGTTNVVGIVTTLVGGISIGSTIFAHYGPGISSIGISTGMLFQLENVINATIVGFGTTSFNIVQLNNNGIGQTVSIPCNALFLSNQATQTLNEGIFKVGILTSVRSISLSTVALASTSNQIFNVIRPGDIEIEFDYTQSPLEPLNIGVVNSSTLGVGHSVSFDISGNPNQSQSWFPSRSYLDPSTNITINPEPSVGAGRADYYLGTLSWPIIISCTGTEPSVTCTSTLAPEGTIAITTISSPLSLGTTSIKGPDPFGTQCNQLAQNITNALNNLATVVAQNESKIEPLVNATKVLRATRDIKELRAWSVLQAIGSITEDIKQMEQDLISLDNINFGPYET